MKNIIFYQKYLLNIPRSYKKTIAVIIDLLICAVSVWLSFGLRLDQWGLWDLSYSVIILFSIASYLPLFILFGLYKTVFRFVGSISFNSIVKVFVIYGIIFCVVFSIVGVASIPRTIGIIQPIVFFLGIGFSRYLIRTLFRMCDSAFFNTDRKQIALIYGAESAGRQLAASLDLADSIVVKGFVDDNRKLIGNTVNGIPVFSGVNIKKLIIKLEITDIFLAISPANPDRRKEIISSLEGCGVRVRTLPGVKEIKYGYAIAPDLHALDMNHLLGRVVVPPDASLLKHNIFNKVVLVTGSGGSIGSELCRQIMALFPKKLIILENNEFALYSIESELKKIGDSESIKLHYVEIISLLGSVRDSDLVSNIFDLYKPNTVFHAAAFKHVPLVEKNFSEGVKNNVFGTLVCAKAAIKFQTSCFVLVSTDKAVRPTNIMGASKRVAEMILQALNEVSEIKGLSTKFSMVRFGNVLGSSGSVVPLFISQIKSGGPISLTHRDVTRYFMTIPEAAQLVIQCSSLMQGGDVFLLDMGEPVRIYDLALRMIYLTGFILKDEMHPNGDIEIQVTGLRPGEKMFEELLIGNNPESTSHPKIMKSREEYLPWNILEKELDELNISLISGNKKNLMLILKRLVKGYEPKSEAHMSP